MGENNIFFKKMIYLNFFYIFAFRIIKNHKGRKLY